MTLLRNSLMSDIGPRRTAIYTMGARQVDTFDPVIAIPSTEPAVALHSWTYTSAMLPIVTTCSSFVRVPSFNIHVRNTAGVAVALSYRIKVNSTSVITGSATTHATNSYSTLRLSFNGARDMVVGDVVELFLWCATAGMNLTSSILDTYATRLFFYPRRAGVYRAMLLPEFIGVDYVDLEAGYNSSLYLSYIYPYPEVTTTLYRTTLGNGMFPALFPNVTYGVFATNLGDFSFNAVVNSATNFSHNMNTIPASINYNPMVLDIEALLP